MALATGEVWSQILILSAATNSVGIWVSSEVGQRVVGPDVQIHALVVALCRNSEPISAINGILRAISTNVIARIPSSISTV